jgi:hypothetical protein
MQISPELVAKRQDYRAPRPVWEPDHDDTRLMGKRRYDKTPARMSDDSVSGRKIIGNGVPGFG